MRNQGDEGEDPASLQSALENCARLTSDLSESENRLLRVQKELQRLTEDLEGCYAERDSMRQEMADAEAKALEQIKERDKQVWSVKAQLETIQDEIAARYREEIESGQQEFARVQKLAQEAEAQLAEGQERLEALHSRLLGEVSAKENLQEQLVNMRAELMQVTSKLEQQSMKATQTDEVLKEMEVLMEAKTDAECVIKCQKEELETLKEVCT